MIYLDYAATTPVDKDIIEEFPKLLEQWGNPSSIYDIGRSSYDVIQNAREEIAKTIHAKSEDIFFTSGGSEANSLALHGRRAISSNIEHASIMNNPNVISTIKVNNSGKIVKSPHIYDYDTCSFMLVNNEIGVVQDIADLANYYGHHSDCLIHTDAVQAYPHMRLDVIKLGVDMMSVSGHKLGCPKGIGFLYANERARATMKPIIYGGKQEFGLRGGTENVPYIAALAIACKKNYEKLHENNIRVAEIYAVAVEKLRDIGGIINIDIGNIKSIISVRFPNIIAEDLIYFLSINGIYVSSGSACHEGSQEPSHVLKAIGLTDDEAASTVRISISHNTTIEDINELVYKIQEFKEMVGND